MLLKIASTCGKRIIAMKLQLLLLLLFQYFCLVATVVVLLLNVLHFLFKMQDVSVTGSLFFRYEGGKPAYEDRFN